MTRLNTIKQVVFFFFAFIFVLHSCTNGNTNEYKSTKEEKKKIHLNMGLITVLNNLNNNYSQTFDYLAEFHFHSNKDDIRLSEISGKKIEIEGFEMKFKHVEKVMPWGDLKDTTIGKNVLIGVIYGDKSMKFDDFTHKMDVIGKKNEFYIEKFLIVIDSTYFSKPIDITHTFIQL